MSASDAECRLPRSDDWTTPEFRSALTELAAFPPARGPRDRLAWLKARIVELTYRHAPFSAGHRGLFVAAGADPLISVLARRPNRVVAVDSYGAYWSRFASPRGLRRAEGIAEVVRGDARHLPLGDSTFDWLICSGPSLNYFGEEPDMASALAEMARVLLPGGIAIVDLEYGWRTGPDGRAPPSRPGPVRRMVDGLSDRLHRRRLVDATMLERLLRDTPALRPCGPIDLTVDGLDRSPARSGLGYTASTPHRSNVTIADWNPLPGVMDDRLYAPLVLVLQRGPRS